MHTEAPGFANARQENTLSNFHRDVVMMRFKAEGAGEAAASGIEQFRIESHAGQKLLLVLHPKNRLLVAMAVQ